MTLKSFEKHENFSHRRSSVGRKPCRVSTWRGGLRLVVYDSLSTDRVEAVLFGRLIDGCSSKNKTFARCILAIAMFANEGIRFKRVSYKRL